MARSNKLVSELKKSRRFRKLSRKLQLEQLEDRRLMALTLVNTLTNDGPFAANATLHTAPRELILRFAEGQRVDAATVAAGVKITRAGLDDAFDAPGLPSLIPDIVVTPGFAGINDTQREVILRFASNLPDDLYRVEILPTLLDQGGIAATPQIVNFSLDLGAQVLAVVPQPVVRNPNGSLTQNSNDIEVYFNADSLSGVAPESSVNNTAYYRLLDTATGQVYLPTAVNYIAAENKATLTFADGTMPKWDSVQQKTLQLQLGTSDEPNDLISSAIHVGGNASLVSRYIGDNPLLTNTGAPSDVDLYRFDVRATGTLTVDVTGLSSLDAVIRVFGPSGAIGLPIDANGIGGSETLTIPGLAPGAYYVGISGKGNAAYNPTDGTGRVTGAGTTGSYSLNVAISSNAIISNDVGGTATANDSSFDTATNAGILGQGGQTISANISVNEYNFVYPLAFPGIGDDPGHRQMPPGPTGENHLGQGPDSSNGIEIQYYNFQDNYGSTPQGNPLHNAITENQKQRAREIFELYGRYLGIKFIESPNSGITVATGDLRALDPTIITGAGGVAGIASPGGPAIMDNGENWGNSQYGAAWFTTAMHEIGHAIGLGHSYDLPSITVQGSGEPSTAVTGEPVFPGDNDILHGQALYRPEGRDIDLYKFTLTEAGTFSAETVAERILNNSSLLNTVLTLYRETTVAGVKTREIISRNDDYFSSDSFLELRLEAGTYYIGVTASGMTGIDPNVLNSGLGGTSEGAYNLKLNFKPEGGSSILDSTGTRLDGDNDGIAGGAFQFYFDAGPTIFVDKMRDTIPGITEGQGLLTNPYDTIEQALQVARDKVTANPAAQPIIRILANGLNDDNAANNRAYLIGLNDLGDPLPDGVEFQVPQNTTVMIDAGVNIKFQKANIDVGTSALGDDRRGGAIQVLGTPGRNVLLTSYHDDSIGGDSDGPALPAEGGNWGGIVIRDDSDLEDSNIFLNFVNQATITFGGGKVFVDSIESVFTPITLYKSRPTVTFNTIRRSADSAMTADPDSFDDRNGRIGPEIYGNTLLQNSINGILVSIPTRFGRAVDVLNVFARFDDIDIVHVLPENLFINGTPGGPQLVNGNVDARLDARLQIDPGVILKFGQTRIEARIGAQLIAEGTDSRPIIMTALRDDRFGAGGTFDTTSDASASTPSPGAWGGLMFNPNSTGSIDRAQIFYAGGVVPIEGAFASFNPLAIHQADVRVTNSLFQFNQNGAMTPGDDRNGRGPGGSATIFVRGAQPIIFGNTIRDNVGPVVSVNANAMQATVQGDYGRATGLVDFADRSNNANDHFSDNFGPLVRENRIVNNSINGMEVRGGTLTTETIWDDTDIAHILRSEIIVLNHHTFSGIRLQSSPTESLVVKLSGATAGFTAGGVPLDIDDRIGGTVHVIGQPGRPVILTSLADDTVPAGLQPITDLPLFDTNNNGPSIGLAGDWRSVKLDRYSNDRNAAVILETEPAYLNNAGDVNRNPTQAQFLGNLAPNEKGGDDNRRLGFEIQGSIAFDNPKDLDVYSFTADGGTEIWVDIDRTSYGLDTMVELLNANGTVVARSLNSEDVSQVGPTDGLTGTALTFQKDDYLGRDFYTTNPNDATMRVVLPGTQAGGTYFIRVRSQPKAGQETATANSSPNASGQTRGEYRLQIRVRQTDDKPGSTVRYADIRYATNGIEVIGLPYHSPLAGESAESSSPNDSFTTAQYLGNLLTSDRNTISVAGSLSGGNDVDFYSFDLNYDLVQSIGGFNGGLKTIAAMFDIDYADGLARPDTTISIFNQLGQLIYIGRDSDIQDDQPAAGQGLDGDDLSRGDFGKLDPYIGATQLPAGQVAQPNTTQRYYVAISSNRRLPTVLNATFNANPAAAGVRLEPLSTVRRIVEDHLEDFPISSTAMSSADSRLFDLTNAVTLATHIKPFTLEDAQLFRTTAFTLHNNDPYDGTTEVNINNNYTGGQNGMGDIVMRNDGTLWGYRSVPGANAGNGQLVRIDPGTGGITVVGGDGIPDVPASGTITNQMVTANNPDALAWNGNAFNDSYFLYYSVPDRVDPTVSRLYRANPDTGSAAVVTGQPWGRIGGNNVITAAVAASASYDFGTGGSSRLILTNAISGALAPNITFQFTKSTGPAGRPKGVIVTGSPAGAETTFLVDLDARAAFASGQSNLGTQVLFTFTAKQTGAAGNAIRVVFTKSGTFGTGVTVNTVGNTITVDVGTVSFTADEVVAAITGNAAANALVNVTYNPTAPTTGATNITAAFVPTTVTLNGGTPSSLADVEQAIINYMNANPTAAQVYTQILGNTTTDVTTNVPASPGFDNVPLLGGAGTVSRTMGMAFLNGTLYGVSDNGQFYSISTSSALITNTPVQVPGVNGFTGLALGPQNVEGGIYKDMLFASTDDGRVVALDVNGNLQAIFYNPVTDLNDATSTSIGNSTGIAFSPLDFNLWHTTYSKEGDVAGHGIINSPDNSRPATLLGQRSFYFGLEEWVNVPDDPGSSYEIVDGAATDNAQYGILDNNFHRNLTFPVTDTRGTNRANTYDLPGGASGSLITDPFSLAGYSYGDKPTVYFNYFLGTQGAQSNNNTMRDSARVYISPDGGATWLMLATNNSALDRTNTGAIDGELSTFISASTTDLPAQSGTDDESRQRVQELFDTNDWRQARVDLSEFAGFSDLRFRFDFSTSGVSPEGMNDPSAALYEDKFGNTGHPTRGQDNNHVGFYIDDIIVGFAERGEMVTGAPADLTSFFNTPVPVQRPEFGPIPPSEVLTGSYQLEIRDGTDRGVNTDNLTSTIGLYGTYDTNERLIRDTRLVTDPLQPELQPATPIETFNNGFGDRNWLSKGDALWTATTGASGVAQSGTIGDSQESSLETRQLTGGGFLTFSLRTSTEAGIPSPFPGFPTLNPGDGLVLYIDGVPQVIQNLDGSVAGNLGVIDSFFVGSVISGETAFTTYQVPVTAGVHYFRWQYLKNDIGSGGLDAVFLDDINFPTPQRGNGGKGDENQFRDQGHIQIEQNLISDVSQAGIVVDASIRNPADGNLPFPGAVRNLVIDPQNPDQQLVPGVTIVNNVVANYGTAGIRFSGDPNIPGQAPASTPFGRIINNTLYGGLNPTGTGIEITDNAGPTVLNNIVANSASGITVDTSSLVNTVVSTNVFHNNTANGVQLDPLKDIVVDPAAQLFVAPVNRNFYLVANAAPIDSSLNGLDDRFEFANVKREVGIPESPIKTPDRDLFGQKRLDDPSFPNAGGAQDVFKDRGAIERADFVGPSIRIIDPLDNDVEDRNPNANDVFVINQSVPRFVLKFSDVGIGIDDVGVTANLLTQFTVTEDGVPLVGGLSGTTGTDYTIIYDPNKDEVTFLPNSGTWAEEKTYVITIDNSAATGVKDSAGNLLLPNRADGTTSFTVFIGTLYDYGDAPDQSIDPAFHYPTVKPDGAQHQFDDRILLGSTISADGDGQPSAGANTDLDDGITGFILKPGVGLGTQQSQFTVAYTLTTPTGIGVLDVWIDLNKDGDWDDANEKVLTEVLTSLDTSPKTFNFDLPAGPLGTTFARFRFSSTGSPLPTGPAMDGEVEDYQVTLVGPPFKNPGQFAEDVNGDGFIAPIDALLIVNYLNTLPKIGGNIPLPHPNLPAPNIPNPSPPPAELFRYLDVDGDELLTNLDLLIVINYLNTHPIQTSFAPSGEGEGEGESSPTDSSSVLAASTSTLALAVGGSEATNSPIPGVLFASSSIVIETRDITATKENLESDWFNDDFVQEIGSTAWSAGSNTSLHDYLVAAEDRKATAGALDQEVWDELLGEIAVDLKVLGNS